MKENSQVEDNGENIVQIDFLWKMISLRKGNKIIFKWWYGGGGAS